MTVEEQFHNQSFSSDYVMHGFESFYKKLANGQPIMSGKGKTYPAVPVPTVAIIDVCL
jgi:hypothetical protein